MIYDDHHASSGQNSRFHLVVKQLALLGQKHAFMSLGALNYNNMIGGDQEYDIRLCIIVIFYT